MSSQSSNIVIDVHTYDEFDYTPEQIREYELSYEEQIEKEYLINIDYDLDDYFDD